MPLAWKNDPATAQSKLEDREYFLEQLFRKTPKGKIYEWYYLNAIIAENRLNLCFYGQSLHLFPHLDPNRGTPKSAEVCAEAILNTHRRHLTALTASPTPQAIRRYNQAMQRLAEFSQTMVNDMNSGTRETGDIFRLYDNR